MKTNKQPKANGRPSTYNDDVAIRLCEQLAEGGLLHRICEQEGMPSNRTVFRWLESHEEFRQSYARARERQAEFYADQCIEIVDTESDAQRARVKFDARRWHASKSYPRKYSDRIMQEHTGADGTALKVQQVSPLEEIEARLARLSERELVEPAIDATPSASGLRRGVN